MEKNIALDIKNVMQFTPAADIAALEPEAAEALAHVYNAAILIG